MNKDDCLKILKNKKFQWGITIAILLIVLLLSSSIRLSNWDLLNDQTTGQKIPLALDPYYFLRVSETLQKNNGTLPEIDNLKVPGFNIGWTPEIMPRIIVQMWKVSNIFGDYTLREVNVFSPVLFYAIGIILFFFLVYFLTKSKFAGILASTFLAFSSSYLYRTMAGFSDHDSIGMTAFFAMMLSFSFSFKYLSKLKNKGYLKAGLVGVLVGALTALTIASWKGVAVFIFMIIPIAFLLLWLIKLQNKENIFKNAGIIYYLSWIISSVIFSAVLGLKIADVLDRFILSSTGIISVAVLGFIILDRLLIHFEDNIKIKIYNKKYRLAYSGGLLIALSFLLLPLIGKNLFGLLWEILNSLLNPLWISARLTSTVAENAQPYLTNWISSVGNLMFFLFILGIILMSFEFSKRIKSKKNKILMIAGFIALVFGILFSRISPNSILNGSGIFSLSGFIYLGGLIFFLWVFFKIYYSEKIRIPYFMIVLFSWMFITLIAGRSTTRLFFAIAPFMCIIAAYGIITLFRYSKKKGLDDIIKLLIIVFLVVSLVFSCVIINSSFNDVSIQAKYSGPSADIQWQKAMFWVRENTNKNVVFAHWWDYGYWVQTLGERATIADGGHAQGVYDGDHKIGRYVLTTPYPETALSFFKTMDVDYLLIDQTDLGKYPAYSKIGGGEGKEESDRYSAIPVMVADTTQTKETSNGMMIFFKGGMYLFEDIIYKEGEKEIFLPAGKAALAGIIVNLNGNILKQPEAVYIYNNIQTRIPIRYIYFNEELLDFKRGLEVIVDIIPSFDGKSINQMGAVIYLSQKVSKSLFARLFLLNDIFNEYKTLKSVHSEDNPVIASLKNQGVPFEGEFIYYQGFRGPIKIWDVQEIPKEIKIVQEFKEPFNGTFGALDRLKFLD